MTMHLYTHVDGDGVLWRWDGERPISALADAVMQGVAPSYMIGPDAASITCHVCGRTSHHPEDVRNLYCGHCHAFHAPAVPATAQPPVLFQLGDKVRIRLLEGNWLPGRVELASENGRSLAVSVDEGLPLSAAGIDITSGRLMVLLCWERTTSAYVELRSAEPYLVEPAT